MGRAQEVRRAIRNLQSEKANPPRFCDVVIEDGSVSLEIKTRKRIHETISWEDMKYQVAEAIKQSERK